MSHVIDVESTSVPFSAARRIVAAVTEDGAATLPDGVRRALRPVVHPSDKPAPTPTDAPNRLKTQLRFHTRERGLRGLRTFGWTLAERHGDGLELRVRGELHRSDLDFFTVLGQWVPLRLVWDRLAPVAAAPADTEDARVARDLDAVSRGVDVPKVLGRYLNLGDPWTAGWLADAMLRAARRVGAAAAEMAALAFMLDGRTLAAEQLYRTVRGAGPLDQARIKYGLAMLYARHHPPALRDTRIAAELIGEAWDVLETAPDGPATRLEQALNRNALALLLYRDDQYGTAAEVLDAAIAGMAGSGEDQALSILYNNLGRVRAAMDDDSAAERALRAATTLDPRFGEYWLDLGNFHARRARLAPALEAAARAATLAPDLAEAPALLGYVHASKGDHWEAARQYGIAAMNHPGQQEYLLGAARECCEADDHQRARDWLRRLRTDDLSDDQRAESELLELEVVGNLGDPPLAPAEVAARIRELALRYPESDLVRQNLDALGPC